MPVSGAKVGDRAMTPSGRTGTVRTVRQDANDSAEMVEVAYDEQFRGSKWFRTAAVTLLREGVRP